METTNENVAREFQADEPKIETATPTSKESITHKDILHHLLCEVQPIDLGAAIELPSGVRIREKHCQVAVVKVLLDIARKRKWNLRKQHDYVYVYNGAYWKQHNKDDIRRFLSDAAIRMGMPEYDVRAYNFVDGLLKQFLSDAHLPAPDPDEKKVLINLQNGTFEFTAGAWKYKEFDPNDFLTYQLPFSYDPDAVCPLFDSYLLKVLPDECSRMVLQEFAGYIFTKLNLEKCMVLTGGGRNGKSVYFNILNALIGKENTLNFSMSSFSKETSLAKLTNVLLNYSSETGFNLSPEIFKALVSGEPVQARELFGKPFNLYNKVKFIMNCNVLPRETENTLAYFRRYLIVPFEVTITEEEKDINLADKIIATELPGVFNWLLVGLERIVKQQDFTYCAKAEKALADFKMKSDTVKLFLDEFHYRPSTKNKLALQHLYANYEQFCAADKLKPMGKTSFSQELEKKGFEKKPRENTGLYFAMEVNMED